MVNPVYTFLIENRKTMGSWTLLVTLEALYVFICFIWQLHFVFILFVLPIHILGAVLCSIDYFMLTNLRTIINLPKVLEP